MGSAIKRQACATVRMDGLGSSATKSVAIMIALFVVSASTATVIAKAIPTDPTASTYVVQRTALAMATASREGVNALASGEENRAMSKREIKAHYECPFPKAHLLLDCLMLSIRRSMRLLTQASAQTRVLAMGAATKAYVPVTL